MLLLNHKNTIEHFPTELYTTKHFTKKPQYCWTISLLSIIFFFNMSEQKGENLN